MEEGEIACEDTPTPTLVEDPCLQLQSRHDFTVSFFQLNADAFADFVGWYETRINAMLAPPTERCLLSSSKNSSGRWLTCYWRKKKKEEHNAAVVKFFSENKEALEEFDNWYEFYSPTSKSKPRTWNVKKKEQQSDRGCFPFLHWSRRYRFELNAATVPPFPPPGGAPPLHGLPLTSGVTEQLASVVKQEPQDCINREAQASNDELGKLYLRLEDTRQTLMNLKSKMSIVVENLGDIVKRVDRLSHKD